MAAAQSIKDGTSPVGRYAKLSIVQRVLSLAVAARSACRARGVNLRDRQA